MSVGAYRTEAGKPWVLPLVEKAERLLAGQVERGEINHEYLPVLGLERFSQAATAMLLREDSQAIQHGRAFGVQVVIKLAMKTIL